AGVVRLWTLKSSCRSSSGSPRRSSVSARSNERVTGLLQDCGTIEAGDHSRAGGRVCHGTWHGSGGNGAGDRGPARPGARRVTVARPVRPGAYLVGVTAALSLPLWLGGSRLARLVRAPGPLR